MNTRVLLLTWIYLSATIYCQEESDEDKEERIIVELQLTDWDLADHQENIARARKQVLFHTKKFNDEIELIEKYGKYLKDQSINFHRIPETDVPYEHQRNHTLLLKPGDFLLNDTDLHKLVTFAKANDHLSRKLRIAHPTDPNRRIGKQTYLDLLATSRNLSLLEAMWSNRQEGVATYLEQFMETLSMVNEAASKNDQYDAKAYWEMLVEHADGYQTAQNLWTDIEPLYRKLHEFVLIRINNYYKTNFTDIPVYLTGSNFGEDWSNLAHLILPHRQMYKDAEFAFETRSIIDIYELADDCSVKMRFDPLPKEFWSKGNFNYETCSPTLLTYSASKNLEILTCKNLTWNTYIDAHQAVLRAGLNSIDYQSIPRRELRYSPLAEAIVNLGAIIAVQNLPNYGFTPESDYAELKNSTEHGLSAKLLIALRILPKLAYYMAADSWRLDLLENPSDDIEENWWEMRRKYQGVQGVTSEEADFLGDPYITGNKPYLARFLGILLQFNLLSYHNLLPFTNNENLAEKLDQELDYKNIIHDIPLKSPMEALTYNYGITEITSSPLMEFFQAMEDYMDNAPLLPHSTVTRERTTETFVEVTTETTSPTTTTEKDIPPIQNDQHITQINSIDTRNDIKPTESTTNVIGGFSSIAYIVIIVAACFVIIVGVLVFKKVMQMKRPRTNNRRFEA